MDEEYRRYRIGQAAAWLGRVRDAGTRARRLEAEVSELRARAEGVGAIDYTRERVSRSPRTDRAAKVADELFEAIDSALAELDAFLRERRRARACLDGLSDEIGRSALIRHYLVGESWRAVAEAMGFDVRQMYRIREVSLCELYDLMPATERDPLPPAL